MSSNAAKKIENASYHEDGSTEYVVSLFVNENNDVCFQGGLESNGYHKVHPNIEEIFFMQDGEYPFDGFYVLIPTGSDEKKGAFCRLDFEEDDRAFMHLTKFGTGNLDKLIELDDNYLFQADQALYFAKKGEINFFNFSHVPGFETGMTDDHLVMETRFDFDKLWVTICDYERKEYRVLSFDKAFIDAMVSTAYKK